MKKAHAEQLTMPGRRRFCLECAQWTHNDKVLNFYSTRNESRTYLFKKKKKLTASTLISFAELKMIYTLVNFTEGQRAVLLFLNLVYDPGQVLT